MNIEVYSDGSATTNDKPGGYGWVIIVDGVKHLEGSGHMENASNNDAELEGALQGLINVKQLLDNSRQHIAIFSPSISVTVTLISDSKLILGWVDGTYQFRQESKMDKYKNLQLLVHLMSVQTRWVAGHSGDEHNERCDTLANQARLKVVDKAEKVEAILNGDTLIGSKKSGTVCVWYKDKLKVLDLDRNIVEDYNREIHGTRGSLLEIREEKSR